MAVPSSNSAAAEPTKLFWVHAVSGQLHVRWRRILAFLSTVVIVDFFGAAIASRFAQMPVNTDVLFAPLCVVGAYLSIAVELQRQRLLHGNWRFRIRLQTIFLLTALAAAFFALLAHAVRENQRLFGENQIVKEQLESVMHGGGAWIGMPGGRRITCQVTRSSFSDHDLIRLVDVASYEGDRQCELSTLFLGSTSVTSTGICKLGACEKLVFLELPAMELTDEAIDVLANCRGLEFLLIDERRLTDKQVDHLRKALPRLRLNGRTWAERDQAK